jgi:hypothetical protein
MVHYRIQNSPADCPYPAPDNPVHALPAHFFQIHFNSIFPFTPTSCKWSPSFNQNLLHVHLLTHTCHTSRSSPPSSDHLRYTARSVSHAVPHYKVFFGLLLLPPCLGTNYHSQHRDVKHSFTLMVWCTKFHTHLKQARLQSFVCLGSYFHCDHNKHNLYVSTFVCLGSYFHCDHNKHNLLTQTAA